MQKSVEHRGHMIDIDLSEVKGGYRWSYTIDGANFTEIRERASKSDEVAFLEAELDAKSRIDAKLGN